MNNSTEETQSSEASIKDVVVNLTVFACGIAVNSFLIYKFWNWFAPIVYSDVLHISLKQAFAVLMLRSAVRGWNAQNIKKEYLEDSSKVGKSKITASLAVLLIGYIIYNVLIAL